MSDYAAARHNMIESQIRTNKVTDPRILEAFEIIPREKFVPGAMQGIAYADEDLHVGGGRYLIEPMILGRLLQDALPDEDDVALEIGCGSGYSTAILSKLVSSVVAVEQDQPLVEMGNKNLMSLEIDNAAIVQGKLREGYQQQKPYSLILIAGGVEEVPNVILDQLAESGRLVTVLYDADGVVGRATSFDRIGGRISRRVMFDAATPILPGFSKEYSFVL